MKKVILFIAAMLLIGTTAQATIQKQSKHENWVTKPTQSWNTSYHRSQQIVFVQNGVKFFVDTEGGIDFKIINRRTRSRHSTWYGNTSYNSPGSYGYYRPYNRIVRYDYYGRLKRVGSNHITYDRYNRVRRIGSITIRYNRRGLLSQVGGLHIYYKKYGRIKFVEGNVHYSGCGYCGIDGCTATHDPYYDVNWNSNHYDHNNNNDHDDYYYKNRKRKKKHQDHDDDDHDDDYDD
ncbi:hypothetical protein [Aquimarina sp. 2201CG5-10]|uniref:hypothetical protein n=1 Tax=Aquimarina callyspongiae TaxID=3098150 RepID=UPI002AB38EAA|nr:hypothetical protein [Aquimarina sp. 2201CG5-10]MDY8135549.1 hypothetical protein [Aquimarina sp. 2201CG5-10]